MNNIETTPTAGVNMAFQTTSVQRPKNLLKSASFTGCWSTLKPAATP